MSRSSPRLPEINYDRLMMNVMPRSHDIKVRVDALAAFRQLAEDLCFLSQVETTAINAVIRQFATGMRSQTRGFAVESSGVADFIRRHVGSEPLDHTSSYSTHANLVTKITKMLDDDATAAFSQRVKLWLLQVADVMDRCRRVYRLSYHTVWHAMMVMMISTIKALEAGCNEDQALFVGMQGLTHDAVYRFSRGPDEQLSADFFMLLTRNFQDCLGDDTESQHIFSALVRVILRFGTLPVVHTPDTEGKPDFAQIKMQSAVEVFLEHYPDFADIPQLQDVLRMAVAIARADIHGSLSPIGFMATAPIKEEYDITAGLSASDKENSILSYVDKAFSKYQESLPEPAGGAEPERLTKAQFTTCVLLKFIQGISYVAENPVGTRTGDVSPQARATQEKFDRMLQGDSSVELDEADLDQFILLINSELFFAGMQLRGTSDRHVTDRLMVRDHDFYPASWEWHIDIYQNIQAYLNDKTQSFANRQRVVVDLLTLASNSQPGMHFDLQQFTRLVTPVERDVATSAVAEAKPEVVVTAADALAEAPDVVRTHQESSRCQCCCSIFSRSSRRTIPKLDEVEAGAAVIPEVRGVDARR